MIWKKTVDRLLDGYGSISSNLVSFEIISF